MSDRRTGCRCWSQASYFVAATLFLLGLQRMASPMTARSGIHWAGVGMVIATVATFAAARACTTSALIVARAGDRHRAGVDVGQEGRDHRHAADGRALQRHGRRLGGGDRCGRTAALLRRQARAPSTVTLVLARRRRADRRGVAVRFDHRLGQARRAHGQALHLPGPAVCSTRWCSLVAVVLGGIVRAFARACRRSSRSSSPRWRSAC